MSATFSSIYIDKCVWPSAMSEHMSTEPVVQNNPCAHDWEYETDWYGDPDVPGGTHTFATGRTCKLCGWQEDLTHPDYTTRDEVMNPPASAARGAEARNLNTSQRHGSGAEPQGTEVQATRQSAAPSIGDPCPVCTGKIGQSGFNYRCGNCGWLGPRVEWAP